ncbi:MAG: hypothetical protein AAFO95_06365, partial [Cyanobacteria bacterium J06600_6]
MTVCIQEATVNSSSENVLNKNRQGCNGSTLVVIDPSVDNWDILVTGVKPDSKTILLDPTQ